MTKIYWFLWLAVAATAAVLYLAGLFTEFAAVVFGFIIFGLVFMGIISILPASIGHPKTH